MATISTRLMITGTAVTSDPIAVDYNLSSNVSAPAVETGGLDIAAGATENIYTTPAAATTTRTFMYIKNVGAVGQGYVEVVIAAIPCSEGTTTETIARLNLGEFLYIPVAAEVQVTVTADATASGTIEYGYFSAT